MMMRGKSIPGSSLFLVRSVCLLFYLFCSVVLWFVGSGKPRASKSLRDLKEGMLVAANITQCSETYFVR